MDKQQLEHFRQLLESERAEITSSLQENLALSAHEDAGGATVEELETPVDRAAEDAHLESQNNLLVKIDLALQRISEGDYGTCMDCGGNIPTKRLEAKPSASLCVECQEKKEAAER